MPIGVRDELQSEKDPSDEVAQCRKARKFGPLDEVRWSSPILPHDIGGNRHLVEQDVEYLRLSVVAQRQGVPLLNMLHLQIARTTVS